MQYALDSGTSRLLCVMQKFRPAPLSLAIGLAALLACPQPAWCQADEPEASAEESVTDVDGKTLGYWVQQLGHDRYLRRETATAKLVEAGPAAIPELVKVIPEADLEVIERATRVIIEIALDYAPNQDGGAWDQLNLLATQGAGRRASSARAAVEEIRQFRADQAREALAAAGIFVGMDDFAISAISQQRMIVKIDDNWNGDVQALQWLRWLDGVENARVKGNAVTRDVLQHVCEVPDLKSFAIIDGKIDDQTLRPLSAMTRIHSLEFRYVALTDEQGDLIASMPIRVSLNLMGTGISEQKVASMRSALPGLQIDHRQGGFLGVTCIDGLDACEINSVLPKSAAEEAGLIKGDIIVHIGDAEVHRFRDLQNEINQHLPGDEVGVQFRRGDKIESITLRLRKFEES
jgi:hypothetical protein